MPVSPADAERVAVEIARLYADAERILLEKIARRIARGIDEDGYYERKLREIQQLRAEIEAELARLRREAEALVGRLIGEAYQSGVRQAELDLRPLERQLTVGIAFGVTNQAAVEALIRETLQLVGRTHLAILRQVEDAYREVIAEAVRPAVAGVETRREAAQRALDRFADRGITGFVDSAGRNWELTSYAEMATRTALGRAYIQGHINTLLANGHDLVIVSDSPEECELCRPHEGKVYSLTGNTPGYPRLQEAIDTGLFHPSCTHRLGIYIPGLTLPMHDTANPEGYAERQQQRAIERTIRRWKRREAAAVTPEAQRLARAKVQEWQARARQFTDDTGRRRRYNRESITRAR